MTHTSFYAVIIIVLQTIPTKFILTTKALHMITSAILTYLYHTIWTFFCIKK